MPVAEHDDDKAFKFHINTIDEEHFLAYRLKYELLKATYQYLMTTAKLKPRIDTSLTRPRPET